ncbi:scaffold protein [Microviridae sp.]|nr:scaffold protein [Microviridae sp.]
MKKIIRDEKTGRVKVQTINSEPTRTDQTQKEQCDIKIIMKKYNNKIQNVPDPIRGVQGDFSQIPSYQDMQNILNQAANTFAALPSKIRKQFDNDPAEMIKFLDDPTNNEEAIKLGLKIKPPQPPPPTEAEKYYANQNAKQKTAKQTSTGNTASDD